jgi:hypothetical protein
MEHIPDALVTEARCEITWGKPPERVFALLQAKGIGDRHAPGLIEELMKERAAVIRSDGMRNTALGAVFIALPIACYFFSIWLGYWSIKLFAGLIVLGFFGIAKLVDGLSMILRPRAVTGSLANGESK